MAETATAADLFAGGRLQLGVSRGSPEPAWHGAEAFGYSLDPDDAREKTALFRSGDHRRRGCPRRRRRSACDAMLAVDPVARARRPDLVGLRHPAEAPSGRPSKG